MPEITKRATFYASKHGGVRVKTFHIETDGCIVNITVGLADAEGRRITRVDVQPDDESRGGDGLGNVWHQAPGDSRIICHPKSDNEKYTLEARECRDRLSALRDGLYHEGRSFRAARAAHITNGGSSRC